MKKSALKEAIKGEISSILSENEMTTAEAFKVLRAIHTILPKWGGSEGKHYTELMGQALDVLQRGEISRMMDREVSFSDIRENMNLSEIQDQGLIDGINAITRNINMFGPPKLKSVAEIQTYVEAFGDGVEEEGRRISNKMGIAMRGWGDEESLSWLVGLKENKKTGQEHYDALNDNEEDVAILNNMSAKYGGKDVILYWLSSGNYGSLDESDIREDEEPTSAEVKKEKSIAAEKEAALKAQKALKDLKDKMKKKAKEFKEAEGDAKEKIKAELKKMTAEKKKLENDT